MKFSTTVAIFSVTLALATSGCRYNKAHNAGDDAAIDALGTGNQVTDVNAMTDFTTIDPNGAQGGDLNTLLTSGKTFAERGYTRCTDIALEPVYFGFDATTIAPAELAKIEAVVQHLNANPDRVVTIEGNCDERGSNEYNLSLGDERAIIIGNFLGQNGISRDRFETVSRGETNPAVAGSGEAAWSQNRRGEFIIWKK